ncbi:MAG: radical SAM-associated putative lipoprotein [Bacteroidales bacterium]|nr:radical SAM-associated putative lipoprotein [Bacteroidales bacterium]
MKRSTVTFLASAAVLAAISACSADMMGEFGTPHAEFEIKGMVADEQGSPLGGIAVIYDDTLLSPDTLYTGSDGKFFIEGTMFPREEMNLKFKDVDGESNGGLFQTKSVKVKMEQVEQSLESWNYGRFVGETEVTLKKAE